MIFTTFAFSLSKNIFKEKIALESNRGIHKYLKPQAYSHGENKVFPIKIFW